MMLETPSPNGDNGRDAGGRFAPGNAGGPGNPFARRVAQLRAVMLEAVSDEDFKAVVLGVVERAKAGDVPAAKLLFAYTLGEAAASPVAVNASVQVQAPGAMQINQQIAGISPARAARIPEWLEMIREVAQRNAPLELPAPPAGGNGDGGGNSDGQH